MVFCNLIVYILGVCINPSLALINHSCDPNLNIFNVYINCLDPNLPQLSLFARRSVLVGPV